MLKRIFVLLVALSIGLPLAACGDPEIDVEFVVDGEVYDTRTFEAPDTLTGFPTPTLEDTYFLGWYHDEDYTERLDYEEDTFETDATLYARTLPYEGELLTPFTDEVELPDYEGKSFPEDGIGEVELQSCIDGDTTRFVGLGDSVRYLHMDAPETTGTVEPWGFEADDFVCEALEDADTIVLQHEPHPEYGLPDVHPQVGPTGSYGRHLAYVWADGRNLNLELVELGLGEASAALSMYAEEFRLAEHNAAMTGRHIHGETDPLFEQETQETTISSIRDDREGYMRTFVNVEGLITSVDGDNFTLLDETTGESINVYSPSVGGWRVTSGNRIRLEEVFVTEYFGTIQLTNLKEDYFEVLEEDVEIPED